MTSRLELTLPDGWKWSPLKFATTFLNRGTAPDYVDAGPVRAVGQAANQAVGLDWQRTRFHDHDGDARRLRGFLLAGDVLINSTGTGTLGRVGYFTHGPDDLPCVADGHVTVARADESIVDSRYMYYWLSSGLFYDYLYSALIVGATNQIELNRERLAEAPIAVSPLDEQRRIADFLDFEISRIDETYNARCAQSDLLAERERAFLDDIFARHGSRKPTPLKFLLAKRPRYGVLVPQFVDDGVPFIRVNDLLEIEARALGLRMIPSELSAEYARTVVREGDLLLSVVGTLGRSVIASQSIVGANIARAICSVRVAADVEVELLQAWLGSSSFNEQALIATSTDTAQPTLGMEDLSSFGVLWPSSSSERRTMISCIASERANWRRMSEQIDRQSKLLVERRQALITAAVTGQIDVTTARGVAT